MRGNKIDPIFLQSSLLKIHKCDFRNRGRQHSTTLSTHVWSLKDQGLEPDVRYRIVARAKAYSPVTRRCGLCVAEKLAIAKGDPRFMLNKRSEIAGKCRHKNKRPLPMEERFILHSGL